MKQPIKLERLPSKSRGCAKQSERDREPGSLLPGIRKGQDSSLLMKLLLLALLVLPISSAITASKGVLHIVLVGGQSNAVGQDSSKSLSSSLKKPQQKIPFFYAVVPHKGGAMHEPVYTTLRPGASHVDDGVGPEISFGKEVAAYYRKKAPDDRVAIIKFAHGGTNLYSQWKAGGDATTEGDGSVYRNFQKIVGLGLEALKADPNLKDYEPRIDAMLWVQGEADLSHDRAKDYAANLKAFVGDLRLTYRKDLPFYFSRISSSQTIYTESKDPKLVANYGLIREQQAEVSKELEGATMVDIDGRKFSMLEQAHYRPLLLHFDAKGTVAIGEAFAGAYLKDVKSGRWSPR